MTPVLFHFVTPEGEPVANTPFEIQLTRSAFDTVIDGVVMPRLVTATTDGDGQATVELSVNTAPYVVTVLDPVSEAGLSYKFMVPVATDGLPIRLQDIVVAGSLPTVPYDEDTLAVLLEAKATTLTRMVAAGASATAAAASEAATETKKQIATEAAATAVALAPVDSETAPDPEIHKRWRKNGKLYAWIEDSESWVEDAAYVYVDDAVSVAAAVAAKTGAEAALAATTVVKTNTEAVKTATEVVRDAAIVAKDASVAAKVAAEAARDAANSTGKVFSDTTAGLAGTSSGQSFAVLDVGLTFWLVYKNNAGSALEVARNYTKTGFDDLLSTVHYSGSIGRSDTPTSATGVVATTIVLPNLSAAARRIRRVRAYCPSASAKTIKVRRFALSGTNGLTATQVGSDVNVVLQPGSNSIEVDIALAANEAIGFYTPLDGIAVTASTAGSGYFGEAGDLTTFTESSNSVETFNRLEIGFDYVMAAVPSADFDASASDIGGVEDALNGLQVTADKLALVDAYSKSTLVAQRAYNASGAFLPGSAGSAFYEWATGFLRGTDITATDRFDKIGVTLAYSSTATRIEAMLYARRTTGGSINLPPVQEEDVAVWSAWKSVNTSALGFATGVFGEVVFPLDAPAKNKNLSYYLVIRSFDVSDARVPIGCARAAASGSYAPLQRGFFRQGSATAAWTGLATTASLAVHLYKSAQFSKSNVGTRIIGGRTEYPFDNSTPKTFRTILTLAAHFDAVRVIFSHSGTSTVRVANAAVAPVAAATNYACSGVTWTKLKFNDAQVGTLPVRPGSQRRGLLVSDWVDVASLARTDDANALPLLAVSAYVDTAATLTLLNKSDGTDNFTNWATHSSRPYVMRYNDGDCVTTPANFVSTTNRSTSPIVGVQYRASSGRVVTVMCAGDSISDGFGSGVTYLGANWAFEACLDKQNPLVAYEYANIAWSGVASAAIYNQVVDILAAGIKPDILFIPNGSPNTITPPIDSVTIDGIRTHARNAVKAAQAANVIPVVWTMLPTNPSVKDYNSSDSLRRNYNDEWRAIAAQKAGVIVADMDARVAGATDGDGQANFAVAATTDGIHPDDSGIQDMAITANAAIEAALPLLGLTNSGLVL